MAYDGLVNYSIVNEIKNILIDGKVDKIYEPSFDEIILGIYSNGVKHALNFNTNSMYYRANLTTNSKPNPTQAPNFCMTLRKYLQNTHITNIYTNNLERIIFIELEGYNNELKQLKVFITNCPYDNIDDLNSYIKQLDEDPWGKFVEQYHIDDVIQGEVTNVKKFGAFVKVADGIEGLVHVSDLSWNSHVNNPNDFVKKGAFLECKILDMNAAERKLTLGLKQVKENPWDTVEKDFPVKSAVKCKVKRIIKNFAVFELPNGLEGICDISDFDWRNNIVNMKDYVKEGEEVNMVIMSIDRDKQRIKLSYKHTKDSPWRLFEKAHPQGSIVDGTVKAIVDSGAIISLEDDLEGYMHVSQVEIPKGSTLEEVLKVGETYPFVVREVNQSKRRISLSRREYMEAQNKKETQNYISKAEPTSLTYNPFDNINN